MYMLPCHSCDNVATKLRESAHVQKGGWRHPLLMIEELLGSMKSVSSIIYYHISSKIRHENNNIALASSNF